MTIYTIGYEGIDIDEFLKFLRRNDIKTVVDVRETPLSRKPGFSKKKLSAALTLTGMEYTHLPALGCPKSIREKYREDGNWQRYKQAFSNYLRHQGQAIADLAYLAGDSTCALLCFEADFNFCHRTIVAEAVSRKSKVAVSHLAPNLP